MLFGSPEGLLVVDPRLLTAARNDAPIVAAALHNLWPAARVNEPVIAFVFGLFHGFGFASVLKEFGLPLTALGWSLLSFNVGGEIGQLSIVGAAAASHPAGLHEPQVSFRCR